jgi:hypothetical protein
MKSRNKSKWIGFAKVMIFISIFILFLNALALFTEIKRDVLYGSRGYGLSVLNDYFDEGNYEKIYTSSIRNKYSDEKIEVDVSQYEAFGRYYHFYTQAMIHKDDNAWYLEQMRIEKEKITWKKILSVIEELEKEL